MAAGRGSEGLSDSRWGGHKRRFLYYSLNKPWYEGEVVAISGWTPE